MLRQAVAADIPGIQRVRASVRENRLTSTVIADEAVLEAIEVTGRGWVAESQGEIVGFSIGNTRNGNIWSLFVHPDHERRGHGRRLHDTLLEWLWSQGLDRLWLTTEPGTRAQAFYELAGWQLTGRTDRGELRYEMQRPLRPPMLSIRSLMPADNAQVLSLNARARPHVAPLDGAELERLQALSQAHLVAEERGAIVGYALAFARDDAYDGEEFVTLRSLIPQSFLYIDQIVIFSPMKRAGIGRRLYGSLEHAALLRGAHSLCCEVNTSPPNPESLAFHSRLDFSPIGSLETCDGRNVKLLQKRLTVAAKVVDAQTKSRSHET